MTRVRTSRWGEWHVSGLSRELGIGRRTTTKCFEGGWAGTQNYDGRHRRWRASYTHKTNEQENEGKDSSRTRPRLGSSWIHATQLAHLTSYREYGACQRARNTRESIIRGIRDPVTMCGSIWVPLETYSRPTSETRAIEYHAYKSAPRKKTAIKKNSTVSDREFGSLSLIVEFSASRFFL